MDEAKRLWTNCIHKHIGSFTISQEKAAIEDIRKFLSKKEQELSVANARIKELETVLKKELEAARKENEVQNEIITKALGHDHKTCILNFNEANEQSRNQGRLDALNEIIEQVIPRLDWIRILGEAVHSRPSAWGVKDAVDFHGEYRNASDEIFVQVMRQLIDKIAEMRKEASK